MTTTRSFLSADSISALRLLLGVPVHTIVAPSLHAASGHLAAPSLSLLLGPQSFLNLTCERSAPSLPHDNWLLTVAPSVTPAGLVKDDTGGWINPCTISLQRTEPIGQIAIFEHTGAARPDNVPTEYDLAILFRCTARTGFCISCLVSGTQPPEFLHLSEDPAIIEEMVSRSAIRLTLNQPE